jgi:V/A-type H+-transporting ATPase subunit F
VKLRLISADRDILTGFRLAGVEGVPANAENIAEVLSDLVGQRDIGVIIIDEELAKTALALIDDIKLKKPLPLIVEIPGINGSARPPDFIEGYIRESMGIKL